MSDRLLAFFASIGKVYPNTFRIEGTATSQSSSFGLVAMNAVAALSATHPRSWHLVKDLYRREPTAGQWRYYDGMLYMMAMMHLSGNFRIYTPQ